MELVKVVLKAEAASFHYHRPLQKISSLYMKDKIMVDIRGWTLDIVVQEAMGCGDDFKVRELTESSSGFHGGTFVDDSFMSAMSTTPSCLLVSEGISRDDMTLNYDARIPFVVCGTTCSQTNRRPNGDNHHCNIEKSEHC
jgi:hypothetical protein